MRRSAWYRERIVARAFGSGVVAEVGSLLPLLDQAEKDQLLSLAACTRSHELAHELIRFGARPGEATSRAWYYARVNSDDLMADILQNSSRDV